MEEILKQILDELKRMNEPPNRIYSQEELATYLQVDVHRVIDLRKTGLIKSFKIGRTYKFTQKAIDEFLNKFGNSDLSNIQAMKLAKK